MNGSSNQEKARESLRRGWHCVWQIHYHLVMPVKYRKALLDGEVSGVIRETAQGIEQRYGIEVEALGLDQNHVHVLCSAHPKYAPGRIVQIFKSLTAREVFRQVPRIRKELWGGEFWTDGYYAGTVGERGNWAVVEAYVRGQGEPSEDLRQLTLW